ncbi:MAG: hypothetical protein KF832_10275 [Caldilineaceae bacterium]|nr:hypothetical protein [Caldilineaceae bacterium]
MRQFIGIILLLALLWPRPGLAHGGGTPRLTNVLIGPYRLFVWSQPEPPRVGEMHFTVAVVEVNGTATATDSAATLDIPVLDATVQIHLGALDQPAPTIVRFATRDQALFPQYYETDVAMPTDGQWQARIRVSGPAGSGDANFDFAVLPTRQVNWRMVAGGFALVLLLSLAGRLHGKRKAVEQPATRRQNAKPLRIHSS